MLNFIKANMLWVVVGMLLAAYIYSATTLAKSLLLSNAPL
jgi:hypothetical protein